MDEKSWTITELLDVTSQYLRKKGIESPRLSAELLLSHQLKCPRIQLYLHFDRPLDNQEVEGYRGLIRRRLKGEPNQYITGTQEFWSMEFFVGPDVLIPRPESEVLVEQVLGLKSTNRIPTQEYPSILDIGTGCGPLAIALAKELKNANIWATDISEAALGFAKRNAETHGLDKNIKFCLGDLWQAIERPGNPYDVIVSNPPYIDSRTLMTLSREVREHEPSIALDGGEGGFFYIDKIIHGAPKYLRQGGWLLLEMDPDQTPRAMELIKGNSGYAEGKRVEDYSHRYRVVMARKVLS